jgi:signal transduction histidine kinase
VLEVIMHDELLDLVMEPVEKGILSHEVQLAQRPHLSSHGFTGLAEERCVGRILILQDITHFKQLDRLKTEFVSTVSHDLRSRSP